MEKEEQNISAFAFKMGVQIENSIKKHTEELQEQNKFLQSKILDWYMKTKDENFAKHFDIITTRSGVID